MDKPINFIVKRLHRTKSHSLNPPPLVASVRLNLIYYFRKHADFLFVCNCPVLFIFSKFHVSTPTFFTSSYRKWVDQQDFHILKSHWGRWIHRRRARRRRRGGNVVWKEIFLVMIITIFPKSGLFALNGCHVTRTRIDRKL